MTFERKVFKTLMLKGTAHWAHLTKPSTKFDPDGYWGLDLYLDSLSEKILTQLQDELQKFNLCDGCGQTKRDVKEIYKNRDDGLGNFIKIKRNCIRERSLKCDCCDQIKKDEDGYPIRERIKIDPPKVVDFQNNPWDDTIRIGNGSIVNVSCCAITWTWEMMTGIYYLLKGVQVIDLHRYG